MEERLNPEGQSRRQLGKDALRLAVATAAGGLAAGAVNAALDTDWRDLKTPGEKIDHFRKAKEGFDADKEFRKRAMEPTPGAEQFTRAEYVQNIFSTMIPRHMPATVRDKLAAVSTGIPSQESRFRDKPPPGRAGAVGAWQFMQNAIDNLNTILGTRITLKNVQDFKVATPLAFAYFDRVIYPTISESVDGALGKFGLSENPEAAEQFLVYCMINAYNAGPGRLTEILEKFSGSYSTRHIHPAYEYTPLSLFHSMAELAKLPLGSLSSRYRTESGEYVFRVLAGAESLDADHILRFNKTLAQAVADGTKHTVDVFLQEALKPAALGIVGGIGGHLAYNMITDPTPKGATHDLSRRAVLKGGIAAGAGVGAHHFYKGNIPMPSDVSTWWRTAEKEKAAPRFADGTIFKPSETRKRLKAFGGLQKLLPKPPPAFDRKTLPVRNLTSSGVVGELLRLEREKKLYRITKNDMDQNTDAYKRLSFKVAAANERWRCRGVGMGRVQSGRNDSRYLRLKPEAGAVLERISDEFQIQLQLSGLAEGWKIRPIINGILRSSGPSGTNKTIVGASPNSPHYYGVGFDISLSKFDVMNAHTKEFFMTSYAQEDRITDAALVGKLNDILASVLKRMHDSGEFVLTFEPKADHYHISAIRVPDRTRKKPQ